MTEGPDSIRWKATRPRLSERITLCVTPEMKDQYDECMEVADLAEDVREFMAARIAAIREKRAQQQAG